MSRPKLLIFPRLSGRHGNYKAAGARIWAAARPFCLAEAAQMVDFSLGPTGIRASAGRFVQDQGAAKPRIALFTGFFGSPTAITGAPELPRLNARSTIADTVARVASEKGASKACFQRRPLDSRLNARSPAEVTESLKWLKPKAHRGLKHIQARRSSLDEVPV